MLVLSELKISNWDYICKTEYLLSVIKINTLKMINNRIVDTDWFGGKELLVILYSTVEMAAKLRNYLKCYPKFHTER